jgi:hypothetical protein
MTSRSTPPVQQGSQPRRERSTPSARRAAIGGPPVFVPASPRDLAEESGLSLENVFLLVGERELEEYRDAVDRRNAARFEIALLEWQRTWDVAGTGTSREWTEAEMVRLDRASTDCVWLTRLVAARRPLLDTALYAARARRAWLQRTRRGLDLDGMIRDLLSRAVDPRARPSAESVRLAHQVVEYRVRRRDDSACAVPITDERFAAFIRRLALFGDSDCRSDGVSPYGLLHELVRRGVVLKIDDTEAATGHVTGFRVWVDGKRVRIRSTLLTRSNRVARESLVVPDLLATPTSVHHIAQCILACLDLENDDSAAA